MPTPNPFRRYDETDDAEFYRQPRLVVHIDDQAIAATTQLFREYLPADGRILDLMSSWRSHLPTDVHYGQVVGLGMNATELAQNPQLDARVVHDINRQPRLTFEKEYFDGGMLTVSVQYLTDPVRVYQEIARVLKPGAPFITVFSNRLFPTKAVMIWQSMDDKGHQELVRSYYEHSLLFDQIEVLDRSPGGSGDPLYAVVGRRKRS